MNVYGLLLQGGQPQAPQDYRFLILMGICFAIFYFIVMVPMRKQKRQQAQLLKDLQNGNVILTTSGIIGTIVSIADDTLIVRVKPDNVKLQITRNAVAGLAPEEKKS
jgi:preprotein translocase subunit YajC